MCCGFLRASLDDVDRNSEGPQMYPTTNLLITQLLVADDERCHEHERAAPGHDRSAARCISPIKRLVWQVLPKGAVAPFPQVAAR